MKECAFIVKDFPGGSLAMSGKAAPSGLNAIRMTLLDSAEERLCQESQQEFPQSLHTQKKEHSHQVSHRPMQFQTESPLVSSSPSVILPFLSALLRGKMFLTICKHGHLTQLATRNPQGFLMCLAWILSLQTNRARKAMRTWVEAITKRGDKATRINTTKKTTAA
jgi:hypothetical protein